MHYLSRPVFDNKHVCCINNSAGTIKFYQHMMYLQRVVNDPNDEEFVELEIIPAEIYLRENGDFNLFTVPLARNVLEVSDSSQNKQGLIDYIKVGIEEKQPPNHLFIAFYEGYQNYFISVDNSTGESVRSSSAYRIPIYRTTLFIMVHTTLVMRLFMQYTPTRKQRYRLMANTDYTISCIKTTRKLTKN